jgi:hypothetical protein
LRGSGPRFDAAAHDRDTGRAEPQQSRGEPSRVGFVLGNHQDRARIVQPRIGYSVVGAHDRGVIDARIARTCDARLHEPRVVLGE